APTRGPCPSSLHGGRLRAWPSPPPPAGHAPPPQGEPAGPALSGGAASFSGMARAAKAARVEHVCGRCGYRTARWLGRCPECGEWASIVEEVPGSACGVDAIGIDRVPLEAGARLPTGIGGLDRALGG